MASRAPLQPRTLVSSLAAFGVLAVAVLLLVPVASAQTDKALVAGQHLALLPASDATLLELADGSLAPLPLAASDRATSAVSVAADAWLVAGERAGGLRSELFLLRGGPGPEGSAELALPGLEPATGRREPVIFAHQGALAGLAWLEGDVPTRGAVRAAARLEEGWGPVLTVAAPGPGSQMALAGTVLDDGGWLLLWSAFDGKDDEILWSLGDGKAWTPPRPLGAGNRVPDVTPTVVAVPGGAVASWSRFADGRYRTAVSRFDGEGWSEPVLVGAPGAVFPLLERALDGAVLVARTSRPGGWEALELSAAGHPLRRAWVPDRGRLAPRLLVGTGDRLTFVLRGGSQARVEASWEVIP